ncbi:hypothetical protein D3C87_1400210 [compost metagenome]
MLDDLLAQVLLGALPLETRAVVVDVALLLDLGGHVAAAVPALEQSDVAEGSRLRHAEGAAFKGRLNALE